MVLSAALGCCAESKARPPNWGLINPAKQQPEIAGTINVCAGLWACQDVHRKLCGPRPHRGPFSLTDGRAFFIGGYEIAAFDLRNATSTGCGGSELIATVRQHALDYIEQIDDRIRPSLIGEDRANRNHQIARRAIKRLIAALPLHSPQRLDDETVKLAREMRRSRLGRHRQDCAHAETERTFQALARRSLKATSASSSCCRFTTFSELRAVTGTSCERHGFYRRQEHGDVFHVVCRTY